MDEILVEFKSEAKTLIVEMLEILESIEGDFSQCQKLEVYGQRVDRIMGTAKTLVDADMHIMGMDKVATYAELCKFVGYKGSQITNPGLYDVVVALLLDATEMLDEMVKSLSEEFVPVETLVSKTFLDRLRWISGKFDESTRASVSVGDVPSGIQSQAEIDAMLKKLNLI